METILGFVYLAIGALIGGLLALTVDSRFLGRRLQAAVEARKKSQRELKLIVRRLTASEAKVRALTAKLEPGDPSPMRQNQRQERVSPGVRDDESELLTLRDNLRRMGNQADQLVSEKQELSIRLAEADGKWTALQGQLERLSEENRDLQEKNEQLHHQLGAAQVEIRYLRQGVKPVDPDLVLPDEESSQELMSAVALAPTEVIEADEAELPTDDAPAELEAILGSEMEWEPAGAEDVETPDSAETETAEPTTPEPAPAEKFARASSEIRKVRGIGPVYADKLNEAGVHTLADLAAMAPEDVTIVLGLKGNQLAKPGDWIEQARKMAADVSDEESPPVDYDPPPTIDPSRSG